MFEMLQNRQNIRGPTSSTLQRKHFLWKITFLAFLLIKPGFKINIFIQVQVSLLQTVTSGSTKHQAGSLKIGFETNRLKLWWTNLRIFCKNPILYILWKFSNLSALVGSLFLNIVYCWQRWSASCRTLTPGSSEETTRNTSNDRIHKNRRSP